MVTKYDFFDGECHAQKGHGDYVKDEDYEALKADRDALAERVERLSGMFTESRHATKAAVERADALAVENGVIKLAFKNLSNTVEEAELYGDMKYLAEPSEYEALADAIEGTPATSAALAAIEARGVEKFAEATIAIGEQEKEESIIYAGKQAMLFANGLREGK